MPANWTTSATQVADASGNAAVRFQAPNVGPRGLLVVSIALLVTPSTGRIPTCAVYRDDPTPPNLLARRLNGSSGTFVGESDVLYMGQALVVVWSGATPGASCSATLRGQPA